MFFIHYFTKVIPHDKLSEWDNFCKIMDEKHGGYHSLKIDKPYKPRSTGYRSQNHHLHGHIRQIAIETYHNMGEIKDYIKTECPEWPWVDVLGKMKPKSESELTSEQAAAAIEFCHRLAAEQGIRLVEE